MASDCRKIDIGFWPRPESASVSLKSRYKNLVSKSHLAFNPRPQGAIPGIGQAKRRYIMAKPQKSKPAEPKHETPSPAASKSTSPEAAVPETESAQVTLDKKQPRSEESFESYYLKQVTAEFADDIDKIRNASDFKESSVPVLIEALKQSASNFTEEEKERVMSARD